MLFTHCAVFKVQRPCGHGGDERGRTADLRLARAALSQLSYIPISLGDIKPKLNVFGLLVGLGGFEPPTSRLSGVRSNQLSYRPVLTGL